MCGIVGVNSCQKNAVEQVLNGLKKLQYRGYDSAGCVFVRDKKFFCKKSLGKVRELESLVRQANTESYTGMGHTRWATHGKINLANTHPHIFDGVAVVHNGIVENAQKIKDQLIKDKQEFFSQTDTEVILKLIVQYIKNGNNAKITDILYKVSQKLCGAYTALVMIEKIPDMLFAIKKGSGMAIAKSGDACIVASDLCALPNELFDVTYLKDGDIAAISCDGFTVFNQGREVVRECMQFKTGNPEAKTHSKESFMIDEILQQPKIAELIPKKFPFKEVEQFIKLNDISYVNIIGCGSSFFAGQIIARWIEEYWQIKARAQIASEFTHTNISKSELFITISQSGETADTLSAINKIKDQCTSAKIIALVNAQNSSVARNSDIAININAGQEFSVAATKTFTAQLITALCIVLTQIQNPNIFFDELSALKSKILLTIKSVQKVAPKVTQDILNAKGILYTGKGLGYFIAQEGALKIKELSYIFAEAIPCGELKHGTIALIEKDMPTVFIAPHNSVFDKATSSMQEVASREGKLIVFTDRIGKKKLSNLADYIIELPEACKLAMPILYAVAVQIFAYHFAKYKNRDIDYPRNLAKSITVE